MMGLCPGPTARDRSFMKALALSTLVLLLSALAAGQNFRASILGQVSDPAGAAIAGALVKIANQQTGEKLETKSDDSGYYSFAFLMPGTYGVTVNALGFRQLEQAGVTLDTDATRDLPLVLQLGDVLEKVSVSSERDKLETTSASRTQRLNPQRLKDLPLMARQAYSLVGLTPGVVFTQEQFGTTGFAGLRGWDANGRFIINGGREGTNQFLMNGAPVSLTGRWQFSPSVDAVQEFKVMTNTYDAQFGRTGGGTVVTTLKSGGNSLHGSLFHYFHNAVFDANATQNNSRGAPKGKHNTHQFGGVVGGAIVQNKDFFFFSFEGFREIVPFPVVSNTVPNILRDGRSFSAYNLRIYDPLTAKPCVPGVDAPICQAPFIRRTFPLSRLPVSRISSIGRAVLSLYPEPNAPGLTANYIASGNTGRYSYNQPLGRWDHHFGDRNRLSVTMAFETGKELGSINGFPGAADINNSSQRLTQQHIAEWIHILSPTTVFDLRFAFGRFTEYFPSTSGSSTLTAAELGIDQIPRPPASAGSEAPPRFNLDLFDSVVGSNVYSWATQNQVSVQPGLIQTRGRHVLHYGMEAVHAALGNSASGRANGDFTFGRTWSQQWVGRNVGPLDGSAIADLLLGAPNAGYVDYNESSYRSWPFFAFYFQDAWRVTPKLTLTMGLRYDVQIPFRERFNRVNAGFDFTEKNPLSDAVIARWRVLKARHDAANPYYKYPDAPAALYGGRLFANDARRRPFQTDWSNIQPRIGVAWSFAPKTVLRAGAGIFYRTATQMSQTSGFNQRTPYIASLDGFVPSASLDGPYSLANPFPNGLLAPSGSSLGLLTDVGRAVVYDGRQRPIPRTYQYSFGFQRELPGNITIDLNYSGSQTVKDSMPLQLNSVSANDYNRGIDDPSYLNRTLPSPFQGILPAGSDLGSRIAVTAFSLLRPNPLYNGISITTNPWARYRYDSLQLLAERKFKDLAPAGIFTFLFSYTFSKSFEQAKRLNEWNLNEKPVKQLSAFDKPHTLALSGLWELPVGWGRRYLAGIDRKAGMFVNGWSVDWILVYNSGYPVARPDAIFNCRSYESPGGQSPSSWFNASSNCWSARPQYGYRTGEERFSAIRNPSRPQLHISADKTFWLSERFTMQLRGEAFNVTNTPILPGPNTNFRDPRFGQLPFQQNNFPRYMQVALKIAF
jgi:hypothetical protein